MSIEKQQSIYSEITIICICDNVLFQIIKVNTES